MSLPPTELEELDFISEVKKSNEDYISTINAAQAFINVVTWENGSIAQNSHYSIGRKMRTSSTNRIVQNTDVTPDIAIEKSQFGYVVEIKKSLPKDQGLWNEIADQLIKYDDELIGWWNNPDETKNNFDIVLLIHQSRVVQFMNYFNSYLAENNISLHYNLSIISFNRSDEVMQNCHLEKRQGDLQPKALSDQLSNGVPIPIERMFKTYGQLKFFDSEPQAVEYTMGILWQDIFTSLPRGEYDQDLHGSPVRVNIDDLTEELQKSFGSLHNNGTRNVEFPHKSWVLKAMDCFVSIKLARKVSDTDFLVILKQINEDLIEHFARHLYKLSVKKLKQLSLF